MANEVTIAGLVVAGSDGSPLGGSLSLPSGTTAQRPAIPTTGMVRYNTSSTALDVYNGSSWSSVTPTSNTWASFYDFRGAGSATTAYRYDNGVTTSAAASATYGATNIVNRRTQSLGGYTCAGIFPRYDVSENSYRMSVNTSLATLTTVQYYYKNVFYSSSPNSGGFLTMGLNLSAPSWNIQTDTYRDGVNPPNPDGYLLTVGGGYGSGTRLTGVSASAAGSNDIFCFITIYNGSTWRRFINSTTAGTTYITYTTGAGPVTQYGMLDRQAYGTSGYDDGTNFMSAMIVYPRVLTDAEIGSLVANRYRMSSDTTFFGNI